MKKKIIVIILFLVIGFNTNSDLAVEGKTKIKYVKKKNKYNLRYNNISKKQQLDVYYPKKIKNNNDNPVIVFFHGGSYLEGERRIHLSVNKKSINGAGYVYIPISYRLSGEKTFPAAIDDAKTAIRYLKYNRKKLKINPNKIIVMGYSAGSNLASLTASTPNIKAFGTEQLKYNKINNKVAGFIGLGGFYDVEQLLKNFTDTNETRYVYRKIHKYYFNQNEKIKQKNISQGSTMNYLNNMKVPTLLLHGDKDITIDYSQTSNYCKLLRESGNKRVSCYRDSGKNHDYVNFVSKNNFKRIINWAKKVTK